MVHGEATPFMHGWQLEHPGPDGLPGEHLRWRPSLAVPEPLPGEVLLRVEACGLCHTDLHTLRGEIPTPRLPVIPGHQIVGRVARRGEGTPPDLCPPAGLAAPAAQHWSREAWELKEGRRFGIGWLSLPCGICRYCQRHQSNLCEHPDLTGLTRDGGYAEWVTAPIAALVPLPDALPASSLAPLLCAGIIGYRALKLAGVTGPAEADSTVGLYGFGASAHLALLLARAWEWRVFVFTRSAAHQHLAQTLGAAWAGAPDASPPALLDAAVSFAPVGTVVPWALTAMAKGTTLAINAIHLEGGVPVIPYQLLYGERQITSVTNFTAADAWEWMYWVERSAIKAHTEVFPAQDLPQALERLERGAVQGAAVATWMP